MYVCEPKVKHLMYVCTIVGVVLFYKALEKMHYYVFSTLGMLFFLFN